MKTIVTVVVMFIINLLFMIPIISLGKPYVIVKQVPINHIQHFLYIYPAAVILTIMGISELAKYYKTDHSMKESKKIFSIMRSLPFIFWIGIILYSTVVVYFNKRFYAGIIHIGLYLILFYLTNKFIEKKIEANCERQ